MSELILSAQRNEVVEAGPKFNLNLAKRFIAFLDVRPTTAQTYLKSIKQLMTYFDENGIREPNREDIVAFRDQIKESRKASTVMTYMTAIRLFFRWTEQEGLYKNIADKVKGAKSSTNHKKDALTKKQVKAILGTFTHDSEMEKRDYAVFLLLISCGLRTIEAIRANIEDLRALGDKTVLYLQGKGRDEKAEYVIISEPLENAIRAYLATRPDARPLDPLFAGIGNRNKGGRLTTRTISGSVKDRMRQAGFNSDRLTAHSLRHTAVTLALLGGSSLQEARQFARHASIHTTEIYAHNLERIKNPCEDIISTSLFG